MSRFVTGLAWIVLYLALAVGPLFLMMVPEAPPPRGFLSELAIAIGFVAFAQIALQFVLVARFRSVTAPYGIDLILAYHRQIGFVALGLVLAHPLVLAAAEPALRPGMNPLRSGAAASGTAAAAALVLLTVLSVGRRRFRLSYEWWRLGHIALGVAAAVLAALHLHAVRAYVAPAWKEMLWLTLAAAGLGVLAWLRIGRPLRVSRRPWTVVEVRRERGRAWTLAVEPVDHEGLAFEPGQFAWIKVGRSPLSLAEHPFSFSSSAEQPRRVEFAIKERGDFTSGIGRVPPGTRVFLEGPHGALTIDRVPAAGYVLIAGGIGIAPMMSILRTMADRGDRRPVTLVYGNRREEGIAFREELDGLAGRLALEIVYVLEEPPAGWAGETGIVDREILARRVPQDRLRRAVFVCGPDPMIEAARRALLAIGIRSADVHSERFDLI